MVVEEKAVMCEGESWYLADLPADLLYGVLADGGHVTLGFFQTRDLYNAALLPILVRGE